LKTDFNFSAATEHHSLLSETAAANEFLSRKHGVSSPARPFPGRNARRTKRAPSAACKAFGQGLREYDRLYSGPKKDDRKNPTPRIKLMRVIRQSDHLLSGYADDDKRMDLVIGWRRSDRFPRVFCTRHPSWPSAERFQSQSAKANGAAFALQRLCAIVGEFRRSLPTSIAIRLR